MFSISIFSILFEWWLKMEISSIFFKKKRDFILSRSRARYHARKYSKCFECLTKNTISNILKRYFILSMNYYLDSNHDCFTRKIFNIFKKLSCVTITHACARSGAQQISEIIIIPVSDVHIFKSCIIFRFCWYVKSILQSCKVIVYLFAKDFYFLTRAIICARTYCVLKHEMKIWFRETIIVCVGKINWQWNILYLKNSHTSFFL